MIKCKRLKTSNDVWFSRYVSQPAVLTRFTTYNVKVCIIMCKIILTTIFAFSLSINYSSNNNRAVSPSENIGLL